MCNKQIIVWYVRLYVINVYHRGLYRPKIFIFLSMPNIQMHTLQHVIVWFAKARGLSYRTDAQTIQKLTLVTLSEKRPPCNW